MKACKFCHVLVFLVGLSVVLAMPIYAVTNQVTNFDGQTNPFNLTFNGNQNQSFQIGIPKNTYINNISLQFKPDTTTTFRQSSFNQLANQTIDGGGWQNPTVLNDSAYGTGSQAFNNGTIAYFYQNWTVPSGQTIAIAHIGYGDYQIRDILIPSNCTNVNGKTQIQSTSVKAGVNYILNIYCFASSAWNNILVNSGGSSLSNILMEIGMYYGTNQSANYNLYADNILITNYSLITPVNLSVNISNLNYPRTKDYINITFQSSDIASTQVTLLNATYSYGIDNCSNSFGILSNATTKWYYWKDVNGNLLGINLSASINYLNNSFYQSVNNVNNNRFCVYPNWFNATGNLSLTYTYGTSLLSYSGTSILFNNITDNINFTIDIGTASITANVYDETNQLVENAYIYVQKYEPSTGNYILVGIYKTNFEGQAVMPLIKNTQYYKFLIYYPSTTLLKTTEPTYIYADSINFQIQINPGVLQDYVTTSNLDGNLTFNSLTNNFRFEFTDTSASISKGCLYVYLHSVSGNILNNSDCVVSTSGTILINVANTSKTSYYALATTFLDGSEIPFDSLTKSFGDSTTKDFSYMVILIDIILTIAFAFILTFSIPLGVLMIPLPTVFLSVIHMLDVDPYVAIGLEIAALVVAIIINRRG